MQSAAEIRTEGLGVTINGTRETINTCGKQRLSSSGHSRRCEIWPVPPVPFTQTNGIDEPALDELIEFYVRAGVDGLFVLAYSGEVFELTAAEQIAVCRRAIERAAGRLRIVAAGSFGNDLTSQIDQLNRLVDLGTDATIVLVSNLPDENRILDDLLSIASRVSGPLGLYECPMPRHRVLSPEEVAILSGTGRFVFLKETSRNRATFLAKLAAAKKSPLKLMQANWGKLAETIDEGCPGFCGIIANAFPELVNAYCNNDSLSDVGREALHDILSTILGSMTERNYPATLKYVLQRRGIRMETISRMAGGRDVDSKDIERLNDALDALNLLKSPDEMVAAVSRIDAASDGHLAGPHRPAIRNDRSAILSRPDID
jgi:4-hydroxy-tetrahydrodipicolinate synthase